MKISHIAERVGLSALHAFRDREIESVFVSDVVSDILSGAGSHCLLITQQVHKSLILAASLAEVAVVVFVGGKRPDPGLIAVADRAGMGLFATGDDAWKLAVKLVEAGVR